VDHAEHRRPVDHQPDVHRELPRPGHELLRPVQRVDQPEGTPRRGAGAGGHHLLRHRRDVGRQVGETGEDQALRGRVGLGHRRSVGLRRRRGVGVVQGQDHPAGGEREVDDRRKEA
jgi:hypothetical protein